jgi:hypothetical protein
VPGVAELPGDDVARDPDPRATATSDAADDVDLLRQLEQIPRRRRAIGQGSTVAVSGTAANRPTS